MPTPSPRKERLEALLALARMYRGWSMKELSHHLGRDPQSIIPDSGIPKLDLLLRMADALDWPVEMVIDFICAEGLPTEKELVIRENARDLNQAAWQALLEDRFDEVIEFARRAALAPGRPDDRAYARLVESWAWEAQGRFTNARDAIQQGLREDPSDTLVLLRLRASLANAYYCLAQYFEADGVASGLVNELADAEPGSAQRQILGFSHYIRGNCHRVLASGQASQREQHARCGIADLERARELLMEYSEGAGHDQDAATARTCEGGILELRALLGEMPAQEAIDRFMSALDEPVDMAAPGEKRWIESLGWWCIFACNVAMRHIEDDSQLQRTMAIFTMKADEIAEQFGNWSLREQVWTIEHLRRRLAEGIGNSEEWILDEDDVRRLAGTLGRFPVFREVGWQVLQRVRTTSGVKA